MQQLTVSTVNLLINNAINNKVINKYVTLNNSISLSNELIKQNSEAIKILNGTGENSVEFKIKQAFNLEEIK